MLLLATALLALLASAASRAVAPAFSATNRVETGYNASNIGRQPVISSNSLLSPIPETAGLPFNIDDYASNEVWTKYVDKGDHFNCIMHAADFGAGFLIEDKRQPPSAASPWFGDLKQELSRWGWHESDVDQEWEGDFERMRLGDTFTGLGLNARPRWDDNGNPAGGDNDCFSLTHYDKKDVKDPNAEWPQMKPVTEQKYTVDGKKYMHTGGFYEFVVNTKGGAIIGSNLQSPAASVQYSTNWGRPAQLDELPQLHFASDVYWGYWVRDNPHIKNLRVYGAHMVMNDITVLLVARAIRNINKDKLSPWPGDSFDADSDEGKALIASPIGATIAHLLIGHKAELGIKHINKVIVVTNDAPTREMFGERVRNHLHLFFIIEDVPADEIPEGKTEKGKLEGGNMVRVSKFVHVEHEHEGGLRVHRFSY